MKVAYQFLNCFLIALFVDCAMADDNCNAWRTADVDPTAGQYLIELRTCNLSQGLSAFIQIKNSSADRLVLSYRLTTNDEQNKDGEIVLEPNNTTRAGTCQACAKRYAGLKSWEILSVKVAEIVSETAVEPVATKAASTALEPHSLPPAQTPSTAPLQDIVKPLEPSKVVDQPIVKDKALDVNKASAPTASPADEKKLEQEGVKAEDGTIIPYDQLPPEFRPRK